MVSVKVTVANPSAVPVIASLIVAAVVAPPTIPAPGPVSAIPAVLMTLVVVDKLLAPGAHEQLLLLLLKLLLLQHEMLVLLEQLELLLQEMRAQIWLRAVVELIGPRQERWRRSKGSLATGLNCNPVRCERGLQDLGVQVLPLLLLVLLALLKPRSNLAVVAAAAGVTADAHAGRSVLKLEGLAEQADVPEQLRGVGDAVLVFESDEGVGLLPVGHPVEGDCDAPDRPSLEITRS